MAARRPRQSLLIVQALQTRVRIRALPELLCHPHGLYLYSCCHVHDRTVRSMRLADDFVPLLLYTAFCCLVWNVRMNVDQSDLRDPALLQAMHDDAFIIPCCENVSWVADVDGLAVGPCAICLATGLHILWSSHGMYRAEMVDGVSRFNKVHPILHCQMTVRESGYTLKRQMLVGSVKYSSV